MGERGRRRRVGVVVGRHVDRLQRGDRLAPHRGDALLQLAHLVGQRRLVADRRGHAAEQRGDLGTGLGEPEDVVDEQQHFLVLHVAEVLGHGQRGERDAEPGARRLVHLTEDERGLVEHATLGHLQDQVVALTGALADAGEDRRAAEVAGDAGDHLLDEHRLADAGPAEQADLATAHVRREEVEHLDAGLQHLGLRLQLGERRCRAVDLPPLGDVERRLVGVEDLAEDVEHVSLGHVADRHRDAGAGVGDLARRGPGRRSAAWRSPGPCCRRGAGRPPGSACACRRSA